MHKQKVTKWDHQNYSFPVVTGMGSISGHRIDYNGVGKFTTLASLRGDEIAGGEVGEQIFGTQFLVEKKSA